MSIVSKKTRIAVAFVAAAAMALLGGAVQAANAATPTGPNQCDTAEHDGSLTQVYTTFCDGKAYSMQADLYAFNDGYFVFYGPNGQLHVSGGGAWDGGQRALAPFNPQVANDGSLWCVDFWQYQPGGGVKKLDTNCITYGS